MKNKRKNILKDSVITIIFLSLATLIGLFFHKCNFQENNVVVTYILSVLLIARFTDGYSYGIFATIFSIILFNWYFTAPYFTLNYYDPTYSITFIIMTVTAIITSALTTKVKKAAKEAQEKEAESNALYKMTNLLTDAEDQEAIARIVVKTIRSILSCEAVMVCYKENGELEPWCILQRDGEQERRQLQNKEELQERIKKLLTAYDCDEEYYNYPVSGKTMVLAVLRIPKEVAGQLSESQSRMLYSIIESTSLALERLSSLRAQVKSREEAMQEHYRGNLLRAISHDIRTPLSGIMGSVEMLLDMTPKEDPRYDIEKGVYQDADWLHSLVENILNLTKLHDGHLDIEKQPEAMEEVIAVAIRVMEKRCPDRHIIVDIPDSLIIAPMDAKLISQVLINLLDNAVKHTEKEEEIRVSVTLEGGKVVTKVSDRGQGIDPNDLPNIFQTFYTTRGKSPDSQRGIGLGLSICQSIVEAHGGVIRANNRKDGGAEFTFTLPLGG